MYTLERIRKFYITMFCISAVSFLLTVIAFITGGGFCFSVGCLNDPVVVRMFVFFSISVLTLLIGTGFHLISKDIADELKYLDSKKQNSF